MKYKFLKATGEIYEEVIRLLEDNSLPTSDLAGKELYALLDEDGKLLGSGGLEIFGNKALVRSVCIIKEMQGHGLGRIINKELEKIAAGKNIHELFLLTTTAKKFFEHAEFYIWKYKNYFLRIRPYKLDEKINNLEETNWAAYPSGHATNSYVNAYLYSELIPEFSGFFLKDAYDMAHSREIIGVHYPSDSESGRLLAYQLVKRLLKNEKFKKDFDAAKLEIEKIKSTKGF